MTTNGAVMVENPLGRTARSVTRRSTGRTARRNTQPGQDDATATAGGDVTRKRHYKPRSRHCKVCGVEFTPAQKHGRYCSAACRSKAYRARQGRKRKPTETAVKAQALELVTCAHCGKTNLLPAGKGARYCSQRCKQRAYKVRRAAMVIALARMLPHYNEATAADMLDKAGMTRTSALLMEHGWRYDDGRREWLAPPA